METLEVGIGTGFYMALAVRHMDMTSTSKKPIEPDSTCLMPE